MAATAPLASPTRQEPLTEEVETSAGDRDAVVSPCASNQPVKCDKAAESEPRAGDGSGGGCFASHSEVSDESGAGADKATCSSPKDFPSAQKLTEASGGKRGLFDGSEDNDEEAETLTEEDDKCGLSSVTEEVEQEKHVEAADLEDSRGEDEKTSPLDEKNSGKGLFEGPVGDMEGIKDVMDDSKTDRGDATDVTVKPKRCRLECKECGKCFNRRETFNLHRHFHAHADELTPLTCKECGLTFQHRSSLVKHRKEHKIKLEQPVALKSEFQTEGVRFQCAECDRTFATVVKLRDHSCNSPEAKPYHCPLCRQEFQYRVSVTKHMMAHSQENNLTCEECNQTFPNNMALRMHQRCHAALKPYECPECGMVFRHYSVMEDHRRKHTDNTRSHLCNVCGKSFKYSSLLHQHQYLHTGQKPFHCPECGKTFAFAQNMKAHCRQHRLRETSQPLPTEQPSQQASAPRQETVTGKENTQQSEKPKRLFNCPLCPQLHDTPADLRAHMLIHEAEYETLERTSKPPKEINKYWEKGHTCPQCPSTYRDEVSLKVHLLSAHKSVAQYLEKVAAPPSKQLTPLSSDNLQEKVKADNVNNKSYKCSECGKAFRHRSVLELHMRIHSKDKRYCCKICSKGFKFSSYLQQHLIIHTGKKPYKCPECGKDFAFLQNMRTHQKLHQEKPFRCTSCRKGYSDEAQLQQHMLSHNGDKPHKCHQCDKSFGLAYLLRDHMNTHTGERPHRCNECSKSFSWFSSLLVHQKIHARKRQGLSQYNSLPTGTRMRGRGGRGRRGSSWGLSKPAGGSGMLSSETPPYPVSALTDNEMQRRGVQPQLRSSHIDIRPQKEPWLSDHHPPPVQWKVDGGEVMPVPSSQHVVPTPTQFDSQPGVQQLYQRPGWAHSTLISQSAPASAQTLEAAASVISSPQATAPKKSSPSSESEIEQHRQAKPVTWSSTATSTASLSSLHHEFSAPTAFIDGAALWSVRPPLSDSQSSPSKLGQDVQLPRWAGTPASTQREPATPPKKDDGRVKDKSNPHATASTVNQTPASAQTDQSSPMSVSTSVTHGAGTTVWELQTSPGISKTNSPDKPGNNQEFQLQQKQLTSSWASVSTTTTQKVPITIQYEPHRFGQGLATAVWGFQNTPVGPQPLLTGQLKPGNGQDLQQQPIVTGTQIIINQPSPFFTPPLAPLPPLALPGPHSLHSVAVGALPRPPNIFFTPQPQTLPLPQLAPQTEPHKLGPRLPFPPDRLLQCMICGCTLPRELDLQMHYLQHAQGEI